MTYADACVLYIRNHMWGGLPFQAALLAVGVGRYTPRLRIGSVRLSTICCPSPRGLWERKWAPGPKSWSEYAVTTRNVRAEYADWRQLFRRNCPERVAEAQLKVSQAALTPQPVLLVHGHCSLRKPSTPSDNESEAESAGCRSRY